MHTNDTYNVFNLFLKKMWLFREAQSCKLGDMIFQSYMFFSLALGVQKFEPILVGGYCTWLGLGRWCLDYLICRGLGLVVDLDLGRMKLHFGQNLRGGGV